MPQAVSPGGSATLYGVLYQLLGSLHQAARLQVQGDPARAARLVVEPLGGGGDLQVEESGSRRIEQWKARTNGRPWGLQEILDKVIPDLYRDSALDLPADQARYVFATEGHLGEKARAFFQRLHQRPMPEKKPLAGLVEEDLKLIRATAREIRKLPAFRSEPINQTYWKLRRLLNRFEVRENQTADRLIHEIDRWLLPRVDYVEHIQAKRDELCTLLLRRGVGRGSGNTFMPEDLLREAGLYGISLDSEDDVRRTARKVLDSEIKRRKYDEAKDVREPPVWPEERSVLFLSGESGQGKTWQLTRLALDRWNEQRLVSLVDSRGDADRDLERASDLLWKQAWGHDQRISLGSLAERWKMVRGTAGMPWLTVCVDNVQSLSEARVLVREGDWEKWGAELVLTGPAHIGDTLAQEEPERVHHVKLRDFTPLELREYLRRHGRFWDTVPEDVRDTLKRPLLAGIYTTLGSDPDFHPTHEYDLYERSWRRLGQELGEHVQRDFHLVKSLALRLLGTEAHYPWTWEDLKNAGVDPEAQSRLEKFGWWTRKEEGAEVWHDRMLSWAVAVALADRVRSGSGSPAADLLWAREHAPETRIKRILGYVPMDLLWIVSDDPAKCAPVADLLIHLEEDDGGFGSRWLHRSNLPTLGSRIIPGFLERMRRLPNQDRHSFFSPAVEILSKILDREPGGGMVLPRLLTDHSQLVRRIAVGTLVRHPHAEAIGSLWNLLRRDSLLMEETQRNEGVLDRRSSFAALRACLELEPDWLRSKIRSIKPQGEPVWELAYLLANLKHPVARPIWLDVKGELFEKVPSGKLHSLMVCMRVFRDRKELSRLEGWLPVKEKWTYNIALEAIAWIDSDRAVSLLTSEPLDQLLASHRGWLQILLLNRPEETRRALRERMSVAGEGFWRVARLYSSYEERLDHETLEALLDRIVIELEGGTWKDIRVPLHQLSRIHRVDLLRCFEARAGTDFDHRLGDLGSASLGSAPHDRKEIFAVLLKIGGVGLRRLIRAGLASEDPELRSDAIVWGLTCPEEIASIPEAGMWVVAALGEDRVLVEQIMAWEEEIENDNLAILWRLRRWKEPISDTDLAPALEGLVSSDLQRRVRGMAAISISGRQDLLLRLPEWLSGLDLSTEDLGPLDDRASYLVCQLADERVEDLEQIARSLDVSCFSWTALQILHEDFSTDLASRLEAYLLERYTGNGELDSNEMNLALSLEQCRQVSLPLLQAVWKSGKNLPEEMWSSKRFYPTVSRIESEEIREAIWKEAFEARSTNFRIGAIRALHSFEPEEAIRAARKVLENPEAQDRADFVPLLLEVGGAEAVPLLIDLASRERKTEVLWKVARVLRRAGPEVETELRERLKSPEIRMRDVSAHLAGWQGPGFLETELQRMAEDEPDTGIQWECLQALNRQNKERCVLELMETFRSALGAARWSYLESILELGDPKLLVTEADRLWLGHILSPELGVMEEHANFRIKERIAEIRRTAEQRDRSTDG